MKEEDIMNRWKEYFVKEPLEEDEYQEMEYGDSQRIEEITLEKLEKVKENEEK